MASSDPGSSKIQSLQDKLTEMTAREEQYKKGIIEVTAKLKEKNKDKLKEKDSQIAELKDEIQRMQAEYQEVKASNLSMIDQFGEISREFDFDKNTSVLENIKQLGANVSSYDDKIEVLNQEKTKIVSKITSCLENAGVDLDDVPEGSLDSLLKKLDELLLNYREDSHQMTSLNSMNQNLTKEN